MNWQAVYTQIEQLLQANNAKRNQRAASGAVSSGFTLFDQAYLCDYLGIVTRKPVSRVSD